MPLSKYSSISEREGCGCITDAKLSSYSLVLFVDSLLAPSHEGAPLLLLQLIRRL